MPGSKPGLRSNPNEPSIAMLHSSSGKDNAEPSMVTKDDMKRTTRLSIEFLHRELKIFASNSRSEGQVSGLDAQTTPALCPLCGSPWVTVAAAANGDVPVDLDSIYRALQQYGLHLHIPAAGQLSICRKSLEEVKERL